jgi:hypothetical protein
MMRLMAVPRLDPKLLERQTLMDFRLGETLGCAMMA